MRSLDKLGMTFWVSDLTGWRMVWSMGNGNDVKRNYDREMEAEIASLGERRPSAGNGSRAWRRS